MAVAFIYLSYRPHRTAKRIERFYQSLAMRRPDIHFHVVTFDRSAADTKEVQQFGDCSVRRTIYGTHSLDSLGYQNKTCSGWLKFQDEGFVDLPIILFSLQHPEYETIWSAEDDVEFTGDFGALLDQLDASHHGFGLSCTHVRHLPDDWDFTRSYRTGTDRPLREGPLRLCFLPFFGVSRSALLAIHQAYLRGWAGHYEMTWPAVLDFTGIPIRDIGGAGPFVRQSDRNRFYVDDSPGVNDFRKLGSFGTMNIRLFPGRRPDTLWHPVKAPRAFVRMRWSRAKSVARWYVRSLLATATRSGTVVKRRLQGARLHPTTVSVGPIPPPPPTGSCRAGS